MIVTCEKCAARYKLDDAKVSGRGAKITCPRCRHVFVVFREDEKPSKPRGGSAPSLLPEDAPASPAAEPPRPSLAASQPPAASPPPAQPRQVIGAPGPLGGSRPGATAASALPTPSAAYSPSSVGASSVGASGSGVGAASARPRRDVHTLDFRKVGISSWKVRVKIGLIYDFSDYKTLRKYIQDGRVTASDLLSYDGKAWVPIGDIPDLEMYFIEVYEAAEKKQEREESRLTGSDNPFGDESPTAVVGMSELAASSLAGNLATERASAPIGGPPGGGGNFGRSTGQTLPPMSSPLGGSRSSTPTLPPAMDGGFRTAGRSPRSNPTIPPTPAAAVPKGKTGEREGLGAGGVVLVLLVIGAIGAWTWLNFFQAPPAEPPKPVVEAVEAPPAPDPEAIREKVREELQRELESTEAADPIQIEEEPRLIPVRPKDMGGSSTSSTPRTTQGAARSDPPPTGIMTTSPASAKDHAQVGDDAWRSGDYKTAATAYKKAVELESSNAVYQGKLGRALYRTGDNAGASAALRKASSGGWTEASKWLGHIARDQGDDPGAIGHYNDYLKSSPSDAADIQREIDKLTGS